MNARRLVQFDLTHHTLPGRLRKAERVVSPTQKNKRETIGHIRGLVLKLLGHAMGVVCPPILLGPTIPVVPSYAN